MSQVRCTYTVVKTQQKDEDKGEWRRLELVSPLFPLAIDSKRFHVAWSRWWKGIEDTNSAF